MDLFKTPDTRDAKGETVLIKKVIDGYWILLGPIRPIMRLESRDQATRMAKSLWSNFVLQYQYDGIALKQDYRNGRTLQ